MLAAPRMGDERRQQQRLATLDLKWMGRCGGVAVWC